MDRTKFIFLQHEFIPLVYKIDPAIPPRWGKMNEQQMVEHVSDFFKLSSDKLRFALVTPLEQLPKFKEFLNSEKEFRENTKAPILPEEPMPVRKANIQEAIKELENEVKDFIEYFKDDSEKKTMHPVFGELNFHEWVQLHHKHVKHHLKQFGVSI
jgi:oxepin-CoA hydrolase/3-oxo-5,6-dehydrosuberyl-CoA semialdehyde dehydrogenase